ncbi:hypothetical protein LR48_Vigan549s009500 [Vigna angularis]|uniref:Uncharacterized protein n=1 Tax=Phaseolus angularis TaxID=3914 RepID=A0A0L9TD56_PHAAN|nr:hypothetical protein LR48_Vigan549s009500 [Vigna angularis]
MAASLSSFFFVQPRRPYPKRSNTRLIKVQNYQDEERWTSVDGDLNVLKKRIEMVRVKERLERCCRSQHGWNYVPLYNDKIRGNKEFNVIEFVGLVCSPIILFSPPSVNVHSSTTFDFCLCPSFVLCDGNCEGITVTNLFNEFEILLKYIR